MQRRFMLIFGLLLVAVVIIIALTAALIPQETNPAFAAAITFTQAAATGDDATALSLLNESMQAWVADNCPDNSVSACVADYVPAEWGGLQSIVFRRAAPDGDAWDVDLIGTYAEGQGFSGVCIYNRVEQTDEDEWRVAGYAGFIHCGDPASRNMADNPDAPNRAP